MNEAERKRGRSSGVSRVIAGCAATAFAGALALTVAAGVAMASPRFAVPASLAMAAATLAIVGAMSVAALVAIRTAGRAARAPFPG
jgi:hypothetical protein